MAKQYRCAGEVFRVLNKGECPDVTKGELYLLKMCPDSGELFFYDDVGEKNYGASWDPTPYSDGEYHGMLDEPGQIEVVYG